MFYLLNHSYVEQKFFESTNQIFGTNMPKKKTAKI